MPKMNVAFSLDAEEFARFDGWRSSRSLTRGAALVALLDMADSSVGVVPDEREPRFRMSDEVKVIARAYVESRPVDGRLESLVRTSMAAGIAVSLADDPIDLAPTGEPAPPLIRSPKSKAAALEMLKPKMEVLPDVKGLHEKREVATPEEDMSGGVGGYDDGEGL